MQSPARKDVPGVEKTSNTVETMEVEQTSNDILEDHDMVLEDEPGVPVAPEDPKEDARTKNNVVTEYLPIDPKVITKIMQTLRECQSRKLITADPRNLATFHRGSMTSARAGFWAADPIHGSTTTSAASFFDIVYGNEGIQHHLLLANLRDTNRSAFFEQQDVVQDVDACSPESSETRNGANERGALHSETGREITSPPEASEINRPTAIQEEVQEPKQDTEMNETETLQVEKCSTNTHLAEPGAYQDHHVVRGISASNVSALPESRALVSAKSKVAVPPIWIDVCQAIMDLQKKNPEALRMLAASTVSTKPAVRFTTATDSNGVEFMPSSKEDDAHASSILQDETPRLKRKSEIVSQAPIVSDEKQKKTTFVEDENRQSEGKKPRRHRTEQEKLERREKKRQKKEKRERKKQKKAERKERKRKALEQKSSADAEDIAGTKRQKVEENHDAGQKLVEMEDTSAAHAATAVEAPRVPEQSSSGPLPVTGDLIEPRDAEQPSMNAMQSSSVNRGVGTEENEVAYRVQRPDNRRQKPATDYLPVSDDIRNLQGNNTARIHQQKQEPQQQETDPFDGAANITNKLVEEETVPQLRALCSESFFEEWTEAVPLLASGQWRSLCAPPQKQGDDVPPPLGPSIQLFDIPLLDEGGIDIELPGHAILVFRLSSWGTTGTANACAKRLVRLAALEIYKEIDVIICADVDITAALAVDIAFVQNAVIVHGGLNCACSPSFQVIAPRLLAPVVASRVLSTPTQGISTESFINASISDIRLQERARFLRTLAPSLSVCGAIQLLVCLSHDVQDEDDITSQGMQRLIRHSSSLDRRLFGNDKLYSLNANALRQLSLAINVSMSYDT